MTVWGGNISSSSSISFPEKGNTLATGRRKGVEDTLTCLFLPVELMSFTNIRGSLIFDTFGIFRVDDPMNVWFAVHELWGAAKLFNSWMSMLFKIDLIFLADNFWAVFSDDFLPMVLWSLGLSKEVWLVWNFLVERREEEDVFEMSGRDD